MMVGDAVRSTQGRRSMAQWSGANLASRLRWMLFLMLWQRSLLTMLSRGGSYTEINTGKKLNGSMVMLQT